MAIPQQPTIPGTFTYPWWWNDRQYTLETLGKLDALERRLRAIEEMLEALTKDNRPCSE